MISEKATVVLIVELRSIAKVLEAEPFTMPAPLFLDRIRVVSMLAADVLEEGIHAS